MTTTRLYKSTDAGAPVLSGSLGALASLLKQCLVGVGGVAYGSGITEKTAAGWSIPFEDVATNLVVFRNSLAAGGSGCYARISDNGAGSYGAREARMVVYGAMSDINTGTDPTPKPADRANGGPMRKSVDVSATARPWVLLADERTFYLCVDFNSINVNEKAIYGAGDFLPHIPGDPAPFFALVLASDTISIDGQPLGDWIVGTNGFTGSATSGLYLGRGYDGAVGSVAARVNSRFPVSEVRSGMGGPYAPLGATSPGSGVRYFDPAILVEGGAIRGVLRGLFTTGNDLSTSVPGTLFTGVNGRPPGSSLCSLSAGQRTGAYASFKTGQVLVECALEWP